MFRYFKKEMVSNPLYLSSGNKVSFSAVVGTIGYIASDDVALCLSLGEASRLKKGGCSEITEDNYNEATGRAAIRLSDLQESSIKSSACHYTLKANIASVIGPSFYHSGDLGDIIYSLVAIKELSKGLGPARVILGPDNRTPMQTREVMTVARFNLIASLIGEQDYVESVTYSTTLPSDLDYDLNQFRMGFYGPRIDIAPGMNLARCHLKHFKVKLDADEKPWLSVGDVSIPEGKTVVISRSSRYHNPRFNWIEVMRRYGKHAVFVGTETEWREFSRSYGDIDYFSCKTLLDAARVISAATLFIGNQSCPFSIAEAMKQNVILEVSPQAPNCIFPRSNSWQIISTPSKLPNLGSLANTTCKKVTAEFDENYFMRGQETGVSNYTNYSWMPEVTLALAKSIRDFLNIKKTNTVLDFGCARGFLVRAFRELSVSAYGCDVSTWAIKNCDESVKDFVFDAGSITKSYDWVIAKDVLEHVPLTALTETVSKLLASAKVGMFIVVPLTTSEMECCEFICPRDNQDATHVIKWSLPTWLKFLRKIDQSFIYQGSFHVPYIKQASEPFEASCGFITARKL